MKLTYFNQDQALAYLAERPERFPYQMVWRLSSVELGAARIPVNDRPGGRAAVLPGARRPGRHPGGG